jgi:N-acetyl-anhydromuramyl-L-alanine amidase AmpD
LNIIKRKTKKTQILLYDTQRKSDDFINKIKYRKNGKYDNIPHFLITKLGMVYSVFDTNYWSNMFDDANTDKKIIKIAIENLGWLNKNTINGLYNNWIGDPYRLEPLIKNWRNYYFWDRYNDSQMESISELCEHLCEKHNIIKQNVPSQMVYDNLRNFNGVVCKSNYSNIYTDINPSFNFSKLFDHAKKSNSGI